MLKVSIFRTHKICYMKKAFLMLFLLLSFSSALYSQKTSKEIKWPGFIQLNDSVLISQTEVSIRDYSQLFLYLKTFFGSSVYFKDLLPDPNFINWTGYNFNTKETFPISILYDIIDSSIHSAAATKINNADTNVSSLYFIWDKPIVNLTKQQALLYCEFSSRAFSTLKKNTKKERKWHLPDSVYFRLPTEEEFILASQANDPNAKQFKHYKEQGTVISKTYYDSVNTGELLPVSVYRGNINARGLINLRGNIAEMVMNSPYAFGGSFVDPLADCTPLIKSKFQPPQQNIGFRMVAVIVK